MIEKERLKELIKQKAKVYGIGKNNNVFCVGLKFKNFDKWNEEFKKQKFKTYSNFFETKEEAECELEFGNIQRTETLKLPTWEEFFNSGKSIVFRDAYGDIQELKQYNREIYINEQYCGYLTKENYIEACKLCKKLFLGESEDV